MPATRATESRDENGFTILELVVALGLLAFVMSALAGVFYSAANVAVQNNLRTQATGVATRALESLRVSVHAELGFYEDQEDYSADGDPCGDPSPTVSLGATTPAGTEPKHLPFERVDVPESNIAYEVTRCIVWTDGVDPLTSAVLDDAYKKTMVVVRWVDAGGREHFTDAESIVYPGGLGDYAGPQTAGSGGGGGGASACSPFTPTNVTVTLPAAPVGETQVDVAWTDASTPDHYTVEWDADSPYNFTPATASFDTADGTVKSTTIAGLSPGTTYEFRITSHCDQAETASSTPTVCNAAANCTVTTHASSSPTCTFGNLSVTGVTSGHTAKTYLKSNGQFNEDLSLSLVMTSACTGTFTVQVRGPSPSTSLISRNGGTFALSGAGTTKTGSADVRNTASNGAGTYAFTVHQNGGSAVSTKTFLVCGFTNSPSGGESTC